MNSEAAFLFSTFKEFYKCWRSGTRARVFIESFNGGAFVNFSAYLGHPDDVHFRPRPSKGNPSRGPRKKSEKRIKRDNDRAARFQERKRKEEEAASASKSGNPDAIVTSSPGAASAMTVSDREFSFASPVPENLRQDKSKDTSMNVSDEIDLKEQEEVDIAPGPEIQNEEKAQDHENSRADLVPECKHPHCTSYQMPSWAFQSAEAAAAPRLVCFECKLEVPPGWKSPVRICHSRKEECINFRAAEIE